MSAERILVIKLGALGDLVLCFRAFASIRAAYPQARIALLTGPVFVSFARLLPWFDEVLVDPRPSGIQIGKWLSLRRDVMRYAPTRVFDFQAKTRQSILYALCGGPFGPFWSGAAPFCAAPRLWPPLPSMHYTDFIAAQLDRAGVPMVQDVDLSWFAGDIGAFSLPDRMALLIPGCAPTRLYKRWPAEDYASVAMWLLGKGITPVLIGTTAEAEALRTIAALVPSCVDLCGQTSLSQIASLARKAMFVLGNDTGPMHIAAACGAPSLTLIASDRVNPVWSAPKGKQAAFLAAAPLGSLSTASVLEHFSSRLA